MNTNELTELVIGAAVEVHRTLGPGLLESAYANAMAIELALRDCKFEQEVPLMAYYKGRPLGIAYRADLLVEGRLLVEFKAVEALQDVHVAQVLSYLRLCDKRLGLLINFNQATLLQGVRRVAN